MLGHGIRADPKSYFLGGMGDGGRTRQQTCGEKHFDSCKLSVYIWRSPQTPTRAPAGGVPCPRPPVATLTSEPGYTTDLHQGGYVFFTLSLSVCLSFCLSVSVYEQDYTYGTQRAVTYFLRFLRTVGIDTRNNRLGFGNYLDPFYSSRATFLTSSHQRIY